MNDDQIKNIFIEWGIYSRRPFGDIFNKFIDRELETLKPIVLFDVSLDKTSSKNILTSLIKHYEYHKSQIYRDIVQCISSTESREIRCYLYELIEMLLDKTKEYNYTSLENRIKFLKYFASIARSLFQNLKKPEIQLVQQVFQKICFPRIYNLPNSDVMNTVPEEMMLEFFCVVSELLAVNPLFATISGFSHTRLSCLLKIGDLKKTDDVSSRVAFNLSIARCLIKHLYSGELEPYRLEKSSFFQYYCEKSLSLFYYLNSFLNHHLTPDVFYNQLETILVQLRQFRDTPSIQHFIVELLFKEHCSFGFPLQHFLQSECEYNEVSQEFWSLMKKMCGMDGKNPFLLEQLILLIRPLDDYLLSNKKQSVLFTVDYVFECMLNFINALIPNFFDTIPDNLHEIIVHLVFNYADVLDALVKDQSSIVLSQYSEKFGKTIEPLLVIVLPYLSYQLQLTNEDVISEDVWFRIEKLYATTCKHLNQNNVLVKAIPYLMTVHDLIFNDFLQHLEKYNFEYIDRYIARTKNFVLVLTPEEQNNYISNLVLLFEAAISENLIALEEIDLEVIVIKLSTQEFKQFLYTIKTYSCQKACDFSSLITLQITKLSVSAHIDVLAMREFFEECVDIIEEKIKNTEYLNQFNFEWIIKNYPGIFLSNNVHEFIAFMKIIDSECAFDDLSNLFRDFLSIKYRPWANDIKELFKYRDKLGAFEYSGIKELSLHIKFMPLLLQIENHCILDTLVEFYGECCSQIFLECITGDLDVYENGVFGWLIKFLYQSYPDLFLIKNRTMLRQMLKLYLKFSYVHQAHFQPLSKYYSYEEYCQNGNQDLSVKCENDFQQLVQKGFVNDTGEITSSFKRNIFIDNPADTKRLQARFQAWFHRDVYIFNIFLIEFKDQIQEIVDFGKCGDLETFLSKIINLVQIIGLSESIKIDTPFLTQSDLEQLPNVDKNQQSQISSILKNFNIIDEDGKIVSRDFDRLGYKLYEFQKDKLVHSIPSLDLIKLLNKKFIDRDHLQQLFFFIPRMNSLWTDVKMYFELLTDLLPQVTTASQLRNMYLLLQFSSDVETVKTLTFMDLGRLPMSVTELLTMNSSEQINVLKYIRIFRMRLYSRLCLELVCQPLVSDELRIQAINALASIAVELPAEKDLSSTGAISDALLVILSNTQFLELRAAATNTLSRLNLDPFNVDLRDRLVLMMKETILETAETIPLLLALLNAAHQFYFERGTDKSDLAYFASLTFNNKELQVALAILLSDQADLPCLIKAWQIVSDLAWPYTTYLLQDTEGFQGGFNTYCRRPVELERSRHHMLWKIKGNLLRFALNHNPEAIPKLNKTERVPFIHYLKSIPEGTRFNLVPFVYPPDCVLFRGIGIADGEQQGFLALIDAIAQGSSGADLSYANVFGQTNSKTEQIFATTSLEIAINPRYFSVTHGFLLCIDPNYFNQMVMRGEYRIEREREYNIVLYHRIPPIGILYVFVPGRFKHDLEIIANDNSRICDLKDRFISVEFQQLDIEMIKRVRFYLNRKHRNLVTNDEQVSMFSKLKFFDCDTNTNELVISFVREVLDNAKKVILPNGVTFNPGDEDRKMLPDNRHVICITDYLIKSERIWDQYSDSFKKFDIIREISSLSDKDLCLQFKDIAPFLPYELRMLIYRENEFTTKFNMTENNLFLGKAYREKSYWSKLVSGFSDKNKYPVTTDIFLDESVFKLEVNVRKVIRCTYIIFFYLAAEYKRLNSNEVYGSLFNREHMNRINGFKDFFCFSEYESRVICQLTQALFLYYMVLDESVIGYEAFIQLNFMNTHHANQIIFMLFKATCASYDFLVEHQQYIKKKENLADLMGSLGYFESSSALKDTENNTIHPDIEISRLG
ncbi:MAG: hypothetical protein JSS53_08715 [Proteobacteria bacterium]|nr:hypothetical protein [Pseudomonadota bacterium]